MAKILIVDDDEILLQSSVRSFRAARYEVRDAVNGFGAVAVAREFLPDLVILNIMLPDMSGVNLCQHLKSIPDLHHVIVLLISNQATSSDEQIEGLDKGADGFIAKPISSKELLSRVEAYLRIKSAEDSFRAVDRRREELEQIIDHSKTVVIVCSNEEGWPVEFVSDGISQFGYSPADFFINNMNYFDIIHPSDVERVQSRLARDIRESAEETWNEYRIFDHEGAVRWVDVRTHLRRDDGGNIIDLQSILFDVTEKKLAELALRLNEDRLASLYKLSQMTDASEKEIVDFALEEAIRLTGSEAGYLFAVSENQASLKVLAWSKNISGIAGLLMENFTPLKEGGFWSSCICKRASVIENSTDSVLSRHNFPKGHYPLTRHVCTPVISSGKVVALAGLGNKPEDYNDADIRQLTLFMTEMWKIIEQKRADDRVKSSERRFRAVFESANDAILLMDGDRFVDFNKKAEELFGLPHNELWNRTPYDLSPEFQPDGRLSKTAALEYIDKAFEGVAQYFAWMHRRPDGTFFDSEISLNLMELDDHRFLLAVVRDITERNNIERVNQAIYHISELVHSATSLDDLYRSIHAVIAELMPARNIYIALYNEIDDTFSFPYYVDEFDEKPAPYKVDHGVTAYVLRTGQSLLTDPEILEQLYGMGEIDYVGTVSYNWLGIPLKTKQKTIGVLAVQSYTMTVQYTEHQRDMLFFVSEQIATAIESKRKEEELLIAKEEAVESSRLKSALLANMSHEFRTPMNGILGFADLLSLELEDPDHKQMADVILASGRRLMDTLETILNLAIIESDRARLHVAALDLAVETRSVVASLMENADAKGLFIDVERLESAQARVDPTIFSQNLRQLVQNAIKFTITGGITIESRITQDTDGQWAVVSIRDTGIGISEEHHETIFQEFRQVSEGYGRSYEGIGLGLTLCRKMTEMMSGRISFESRKGDGSTFTIRFPALVKADLPPLHEVDRKLAKKELHAHVTETVKPTVLAVEDNEINRDLLTIYLRSDYLVDTVPDAETALVMASKKIYDIVLMDINLGIGIDGLTAAGLLRTTPGYADTPIVAITGYAAEADREQLLAGGCSHYLAKPFSRTSLLAILQEICSIPQSDANDTQPPIQT